MTPVVKKALSVFPVVVLSGARQTGKTTLVTTGSVAQGRTFRSLDDFDVLDRAEKNPHLLVEEGETLTLDEVQRAPNLLLAVKRAVDQERRPGRFLLTGSANLLMMRRVSESLAGRAIYLHLCPFTVAEKRGDPEGSAWDRLTATPDMAGAIKALGPRIPFRDWAKHAVEGGYPVAALTPDPENRALWFDGYIRTYLERDLRDVASIQSLVDFRRFMKASALRIGQMLNQTSLARDVGVPQPTVLRWLNLLETSFQIYRVPPFAANRTKRLIKTPKLYWTDVGLVAHLAGLSTPEDAVASPMAGALLENLVLSELLAWRESVSPRVEICTWRTHAGDEVDFVIERGRAALPIEIKMSSRVTFSDAKGLHRFLQEYPKIAPWGLLLYRGEEVFQLSDRIVAAPLDTIFR